IPGTDSLNFGGKEELTVAAWVNADNDSPVQGVVAGCCGTIVAQRDVSGWALRYDGRNAGQEMEFIVQPGWQGDGGFGALGFAAGQWHHLAGVVGNDRLLLYLDGALEKEMAYAGPMAGGGTETEIGHATDGGFIGLIDEVAIYDRALSAEEVEQNFEAKGLIPSEQAADPLPGDEVVDVPRNVTLAWTPGEFAATHNVYLGTAFDDVNNADTANPLEVLVSQNQGATSFDAGILEFSQTYFWRVDEVNGAPDFTVFGGGIWSFSVEPIARPITAITATASSSFGASGPEKTIDGSGLVDDLHGVSAADMWISGGVPATLEYAFDRAYKLHELWIWNSNQLIEAFVGFGAKDVVIEHSVDGENWTVLDGVGPLAQATGTEGYAHNNTIDFGGAMAQYVRVTVNSVQGIAPQASLSEVRFYYIPVNAREPQPDAGAMAVGVEETLRWRSGREADRHELYFGTDLNSLSLAGTVNENSFDTLALDLQLGQTHYWRIDEVNDAMDPSTWMSDVWSFTTVDSLVIDDMEGYKDEEFLEIWAHWVDGFEDPTNGSIVGTGSSGNEPETSIVYEGSQSLPMTVDNTTAARSEATRTFDAAQDWTRSGIQSLVLYFKRGADNTGGGQVYVKINDTKVVYEGAADLPPGWDVWTQWNIDLSAVADVTSVRSLTIGVEGAGATGVLYVDSIQLFKNAPTASEPLSWFEAESGAITAPMQVFSDNPTASAGGRKESAGPCGTS
ncbi:MAG: discoidin domain-containing protein, partial [Nitrospirae bacterium]|nr:discoidin domain-containing protein [Nitrospirota bacterium]